MRKQSALSILLVAACVAGISVMTQGGPDNAPKGAARTDLGERQFEDGVLTDAWNEAGSGGTVGWTMLNTNGNDILTALVRLDKGEVDTMFDVRIKLWDHAPSIAPHEPPLIGPPNPIVGQITASSNGKASERFELDLAVTIGEIVDLDELDEVYVQVVLKTSPFGESEDPAYASDAVRVPLKPNGKK